MSSAGGDANFWRIMGSDEAGAQHDFVTQSVAAFTAGAPAEPVVSVTDASAPTYEVSGWWRRVGAVVLDTLVLAVPSIVLAVALHQVHKVLVIDSQGDIATSYRFHYTWADSLLWMAYSLVLLIRVGARNGQTFGKQGSAIRVVRNDGRPVDAKTWLIREGIGKATIPGLLSAAVPVFALVLLLYLLVDYLWPLFESENRALHDLLAGTHVVRAAGKPVGHFTPASP
jgi:uncharacterized RDD family membrane protein YckC